jgi:hypothetical protein
MYSSELNYRPVGTGFLKGVLLFLPFRLVTRTIDGNDISTLI